MRFLTAQVLRNGAPLALREGERALLFALGRREGLVPAIALADALWPELDGDAAAGGFASVCTDCAADSATRAASYGRIGVAGCKLGRQPIFGRSERR